jgi:hypothetical protein
VPCHPAQIALARDSWSSQQQRLKPQQDFRGLAAIWLGRQWDDDFATAEANRDLIEFGIHLGIGNGEVYGSTPVKFGHECICCPNDEPRRTRPQASWDLNHGIPALVAEPEYTYQAPGDYRVILIVWDGAGRGAGAEKTVHVLPVK